jgi:hypothetical protein
LLFYLSTLRSSFLEVEALTGTVPVCRVKREERANGSFEGGEGPTGTVLCGGVKREERACIWRDRELLFLDQNSIFLGQ